MRRGLLVAGGLLLLLPAAWGRDDPKIADGVKAVLAEYDKASKDFLQAYRTAKTAEERKALLAKRPSANVYAPKLLALAMQDPKDPASAQALVWIMVNASLSKEAQAGLDLLIAHHAKSAAVGPALERLSFSADPRIDKFFQQVADQNPDDKARTTAAGLRPLLIGKVAPEIHAEDTDGKPFKLSDYRGKVVLLDFWGHW
jgi:hypothetical protein